MRKFNRLFEPGTKVQLFGRKGWCTVKSVHPTRQWVELEELIGSFQRNHIEKFTNKLKA
jgi:hypothetical protein